MGPPRRGGIAAEQIVVKDVFVDDHGTWSYSTVIAHAAVEVKAMAANAESDAMQWVPLTDVETYPLHPGLAASWPVLETKTRATLIRP